MSAGTGLMDLGGHEHGNCALCDQIERDLAMATDAANKGDLARVTAGGMEMEIAELREALADERQRREVAEGMVRDMGRELADCIAAKGAIPRLVETLRRFSVPESEISAALSRQEKLP